MVLDHDELMLKPGSDVGLAHFDSRSTGTLQTHDHAQSEFQQDIKRLAELQEIFYASQQYAILIVLHCMDAAGKDGVKHVMTGVNPHGVDVSSFKVPSASPPTIRGLRGLPSRTSSLRSRRHWAFDTRKSATTSERISRP